MELHVVIQMVGGYAREDAATPSVVGAFTDAAIAKRVAVVAGSSTVLPIQVDQIPAGILASAQAIGLPL